MKHYKKKISYTFAVLLACCITGCGQPSVDSKAQISIPIYEKYEYNAVEVQKGDLEQTLDLKLGVDNYRVLTYTTDKSDLEIDTIYVAVGDKVKAGDTLISFKSGDVEDEIKEYQNQLEEDELLMAHYKRLLKLEEDAAKKKAKNADTEGSEDEEEKQESQYSASIEDLKREMELLKIRISEAQQILKGYSIVAEADGTISRLDENLFFGYVLTDQALVVETCGSENYKATTSDDYEFEVGKTYTAVCGIAEYDMKLKSVEEGENEGERQLIFEPLSDMSGVSESDSFVISITKPQIKDVVYVPSKAVVSLGDKYFVYVMDEDGFRNAVEVTVGDTVGEPTEEVTIIMSGLNGGEQVMTR